MSTTKNGYLYPRVVTIQIDVHPIGEKLNNIICMFPTLIHVRLRPAFDSKTKQNLTNRTSFDSI
jgi:hypothetical protein